MRFKTYVVFFILFGVVPDIFIALLPLARASLWWKLAVCLPTATALVFLVNIGRGVKYTESLRALSYIIFIFGLPKFLFMLFYWIGAVPALCIGIAVSLFFSTLIFYVTTHLKLKETELRADRLPDAFDGLRICHIADMHLGSFGQDNPYIKRIIGLILAQKPDIVLFSGDLVNFDAREAEPYMKELARLEAPLGVYSIRGNHDYLLHGHHLTEEQRLRQTERLLEMERSFGWTVLLNEHAIVRKGGAEIAIAGVENISGNPYFPSMGGDLKKALEGIPEGTFTILLSHDPTHWRAEVAGKAPVDLTLSGHTHGLKVKTAGPHVSSWRLKESAGLYSQGNQSLYVTSGLGSAFAFRLAGFPNVDIITLKPNTQNHE